MAMIRYLAVLCLVAPAFGSWLSCSTRPKGLKVTFGVNVPFMEQSAFFDIPQTQSEAVKLGWEEQSSRPDGPPGYEPLVLFCPKCSNVCAYYDADGVVAGILISVDESEVENSVYGFEAQGCWPWSIVGDDGIAKTYWTIPIFFGSPEFFKLDSQTRNAQRDNSKIVQGENLYVSANHQELKAISTDPKIIANTELSNFTEQACMPGMGHHYYYKMTKDLECNEDLFKFFPLVYDGQMIGIGTMMLVGKYNFKSGCTKYFEYPPQLAVKAIVPRGPQCLYDLASDPGIVTMHLYFIDNPGTITCVGESIFC